MIMKPSEKSPLATLFVGKLIQKAGFPPGVFNIVSGAGRTGALLASHMDINKVSFTGSLPTGQKIAQAAAGTNLKRVTLELGGKSPSIVFPDANLDAAVRWCMEGILVFSGQACVASSRVYVHQSIKAKFLEGLKAAFEEKSLAFGRDLNSESTLFGPLVDKLQYEKVVNYIEGGKSEATLLTGGKPLFDEVRFIRGAVILFVLTRNPNCRVATSRRLSSSTRPRTPKSTKRRSLVPSWWSVSLLTRTTSSSAQTPHRTVYLPQSLHKI